MECSVNACGRKGTRRGLCNMHYQRLRTSGDPGDAEPRQVPGRGMTWLRGSLSKRTESCIIWPFAKSDTGYGSLYFNGRTVNVHRLVCELTHGPAPADELAAHYCGVRSCVNHRHIRWASRSENEMDKVIHGTSNRGERHGMSKLSSAAVLRIMEAASELPVSEIASQLGVSRRTVAGIVSGKSWAWLGRESGHGI